MSIDTLLEQPYRKVYDQIIQEAKSFTEKLKPSLPQLPTPSQLEPIQGKMWTKDRSLIDFIRRHIDAWGTREGLKDT